MGLDINIYQSSCAVVKGSRDFGEGQGALDPEVEIFGDELEEDGPCDALDEVVTIDEHAVI
jgi:hypothetical protein